MFFSFAHCFFVWLTCRVHMHMLESRQYKLDCWFWPWSFLCVSWLRHKQGCKGPTFTGVHEYTNTILSGMWPYRSVLRKHHPIRGITVLADTTLRTYSYIFIIIEVALLPGIKLSGWRRSLVYRECSMSRHKQQSDTQWTRMVNWLGNVE